MVTGTTQFATPAWLLLLLLVPLPWIFERLRPRLAWPTLTAFADAPRGRAGVTRHVPALLRSLAVIGLAVALARPRTIDGQVRIAGQGVAIMVALDRSSSMEAEDFPSAGGRLISRLEAAERTLADFVSGRPDDLIGLVAFARYPDLLCPPTLDHEFLQDAARAIRPARADESGTNMGDAIAWSLEALTQTTPTRKVLVLITDGRNQPEGITPPPLSPREGAEIARDLGVTLHAIAIGQGGILRVPEEQTGLGRPVGEAEGPDLDLLRELARIGGGQLFVAADESQLDAIFQAIDALERSPVEATIRTRYHEWYPPWIAAVILLVVVDRLLADGRLRRLP